MDYGSGFSPVGHGTKTVAYFIFSPYTNGIIQVGLGGSDSLGQRQSFCQVRSQRRR